MRNFIKNTVKGLVLSTLAVSLMTSCGKDFLNIEPELSIPEEFVFSSAERVEAQVNGLYASIKDGQFYGGRYLIYNDIRAEEFMNRVANNVTGYSTYQFSNDESDQYIANFWIRGYLTINRVNKFLEAIEPVGTTVLDAQTKAEYIGEAKFIRALTYYSLVQLFAKPYAANAGESVGIPLRLQAETSSANNNLAPSKVKEIYDQILKDLNDAESSVPADYGNNNSNATRVHKNAVIAYKTRVLLAKKDYAAVIAEANKMVSASAPFQATSGVKHTLATDITKVFTSNTDLERVLSFPFTSTNVPGTQNQLGYYYNEGNVEYYLNDKAPAVYASTDWGKDDIRRTKLTGQSKAGNKILTKFSAVSPFLDWIPVIRYAEVLLNLAEAEAEAGSLTRAEALLKAVRLRSDASYTFGNLGTKSNVINAILLERRIEFLGEGFRVPDLQRRNEAIYSVGAGTTIQPTEARYVFPIPTVELVTNLDVK